MDKMIRHRVPKSQQTLSSTKPSSPKDVSKSCYGIALILFVILLIITFISFYVNNDPPDIPMHSHSHSIYPQDIAKQNSHNHEHNHNHNHNHNDNHKHIHNEEKHHQNIKLIENDINTNKNENLAPGYIKDVLINDDNCDWRPEILVGRCFGLQLLRDKTFSSANECKNYCCTNSECITWQYQENKGCFIGGNVRLGLEHASTPNWCEPKAPSEWKGKRLINRNLDTSLCEWGEETPYQCFGLGPEIKGIKTEEECIKECCSDEKCLLYQFREDKGCFTGKSTNCDKDNNLWIGTRKVIDSVFDKK